MSGADWWQQQQQLEQQEYEQEQQEQQKTAQESLEKGKPAPVNADIFKGNLSWHL